MCTINQPNNQQNISTIDVLNSKHYRYLPNAIEKTVQIQIRLLLQKQSDQGLHCLLFCQAFVYSDSDNQHFIVGAIYGFQKPKTLREDNKHVAEACRKIEDRK